MSEDITSAKRKASKPVMEKKRRARINQSLDELKDLILEATMKRDMSCHSKLEKADILEMTVRYLKTLRNQQLINNLQRDPLANYRAGFNECAGEITRQLATVGGIGIDWKTRLLEHLATCCHASAAEPAALKAPLGVGMTTGLNPSSVLSLLQKQHRSILVPTNASPYLMTTSQSSGHQDLIPVLCESPVQTSSIGVNPKVPASSSLWRPF